MAWLHRNRSRAYRDSVIEFRIGQSREDKRNQAKFKLLH